MIKAKENVFRKYTDAETYAKIVDYDCVTDMWEKSAKDYADLTAVMTADAKISFKELDEEVALFRTVLKENGVKQGDFVGMYMPNGIDFAKVYLAITTLGAVAVLLPPHLPQEAVFGCSLKFRLTCLVYAESLEEKLALLKQKNQNVKTVLNSAKADEKTSSVSVPKDSPCTIIFTGSTTGKSKGSLLSNGAVMRGTKNGCYGVKDVFFQRYVLALPLTHVFGLIRNMLTSFYTGSLLFINGVMKNLFNDIAVQKPTIMVLVPAVVEMGVQLSKKFGRNMFGDTLKTIICGAAFVPPYLVAECEKLGVTLLPGYGLTESANLVSGNPESKTKPNSVGYLYEGIVAQVVDGELWLKGPNMQTCYFGEDEENKGAYEDGWFKTGDIVRFDEDGMLYITGRKKEIIVLSTGENVSPAEMEAKFSEIDLIQDCLVYEGETGKLELEVLIRETVAMQKGITTAKDVCLEEINKINDTFPSFQRITKVVFRETDFVRSPSMKILRSANGYVKK